MQVLLTYYKFHEATVQADQKRRKYRNVGFVQILSAGKMDGNFCREFVLIN